MLLFRFIISVIISLSSLRAATETPDDFQEYLYSRYFSIEDFSKCAWEDFCEQPTGVVSVEEPQQIIVSLTSYPGRMVTTWLAIESLLRQSTKPTKIILNLFEGEFPGRKLPSPIEKQIARGLEISWHTENLKVYLKVIPTIKRFPNAIVVSADDDVIYHSTLLTDLMAGHIKYPNCIIARDVREIEVRNGQVFPVPYWTLTGYQSSHGGFSPATNLIAEGVAGVLIPPHAFHQDFDKKELFFHLCPSDDDAWGYTMAVANGIKVAAVPKLKPVLSIQDSQKLETCLYKTNFKDNQIVLSESFKRLFQAYNLGRLLNAYSMLTEVSGNEALNLETAKIAFIINDRILTFLEKYSHAKSWQKLLTAS